MRPGKMRERVRFERLDSTPDDYGNVTTGAWELFTNARGRLITENGQERFEAGRLESADRAILHVRSFEKTRAITTADRAVIDGVNYQIRSITNPDRKDHKIEMLVERGVAM